MSLGFPFAASAQEVSEGEPILQFERSLSLSDYPELLAWGPDNRHLVAKNFNQARVVIIDADAPRSDERVVAQRVTLTAFIAWSPDGALLALLQSSPRVLRLISPLDGREVARRENPIDDAECRFAFPSPLYSLPLAFSPDGASLWVGCHVERQAKPFTLAVRLGVPDLTTLERLTADPPLPDKPTSILAMRMEMSATRLHLTAFPTVTFPQANLDSLWPRHHFAYAFDLASGQELFPHFRVAADNRSGYFRAPHQLLLAPGGDYALVRLESGITRTPDTAHDPQFDRQFEGYDTRTGACTVTFGGDTVTRFDDLMKPITGVDDGQNPERGSIGSAALTPSGDALVGFWSRNTLQRGGLVVLDPRSGTVRQRITTGPATKAALSPDGSRLALVLQSRELRLYRVSVR